MNRWNGYMNNHFKECELIGTKPDPHRGRLVSVYRIPGDDDNVGVSDGVDAWITSPSVIVHTLEQEGIPYRASKKKTPRVPLPVEF